ncbi:MAG: FKBP-type peptidyl-prolyl cis-trans isomerase [Candidatus Dormibacteraeota bacterium]|nr:FKBP-type peptidyl-prolyl cis-trans isomerase [Candidatus Dormibacteraeota bacterium]
MRGAGLAFLVGSVALLAGCGGEVANTTSPNPQGDASAPAGAAPPPATCGGIDSSITDKGAEDKFDEGAGVAGNTLPDGLKLVDLKQGTGTTVKSGQCLSVQYTGWLDNGTKFDSSRDRAGGFRFTIGQGQVIPGWDEGLVGMKVGGRRRLVIPPALAYGPAGQGPIPANATLTFIVEVLKAV